MHFRCVLAIVLLAASSVAARAGGEVIGDSLGVGVGWASKLPSHAKISVSIQSGAILEQLRQAHRGDTVFMSLGTNDAVGGALNVKSKVDAIVKTADELGVKLVWMGPPCVYKPWESQSQKLDAILREELAGTSVTYVEHALRRPLRPLGARSGRGSFQHDGLRPDVAEGGRGGGL
jgi:hypothetical protein